MTPHPNRSRARRVLSVAAAVTLLAACSAETHEEIPTEPAAVEPSAAATGTADAAEGPAGEVAPDTREAAAVEEPAATDSAATDTAAAGADGLDWEHPAMPEGLDPKWKPYWAKIPFVFGSKAGLALAEKTGKPMMMFYSATW